MDGCRSNNPPTWDLVELIGVIIPPLGISRKGVGVIIFPLGIWWRDVGLIILPLGIWWRVFMNPKLSRWERYSEVTKQLLLSVFFNWGLTKEGE